VKNTLWSFGDSFSEEVINLPEHNERLRYVREYLNGIPYKTWPGIVADKLNYNYRNHAATGGKKFKYLGQGNSNDSTFFNVTEYSSEFKRGDIIVVGFTTVGRYQIGTSSGDVWTILPNQYFDINTDRYLQHYMDRIDNDYYLHEMLQKFKILETLSKVVGFTIYYWNWTGDFHISETDMVKDNWIVNQIFGKDVGFNYILHENDSKLQSIREETNGDCNDGHWGKHVNDILGNVFYDHIKNKITKNDE